MRRFLVVKWFLALMLILALALSLAFAAGLRIDFKLLAEKLQNKPDPNVEAFLKMGIDPRQAGYKGKPWWTFRSEDSVFKRFDLNAWIGPEMIKPASPKTSPTKKNEWGGPGPAEIAEDLAMRAAAQARNSRLRAEAGLRDAQNMRNAQQGPGGVSATAQGTEEPET